MGPAPAASAADLAAVRAEIEKARAAAADEAERQAREIARLRADLERERQARADAVAQASAEAEATRRAIARSRVVRAGKLGLSLSGFLQADAVLWRQSSQDELTTSGDLLNQTRFFIKRARLRVDADYGIIGGSVELDGNTVNGYQARLIGAEASIRLPSADPLLPYLQLTIGSFKIPFGFEVGQSDRDRLFLERSTAERAFFPGEYDLGVKLFGGWRFLRYGVAAMNGDPIGEKLFPGRDPNESKDLLGRVGVDLRLARVLALAGGFSAAWGTGFHKGAPQTKDVLVWRDNNENGVVDAGEIEAITGAAPIPSKSFSRHAIGGDVQLVARLGRLGDLTVYGELYYATNLDRGLQVADPVATGRDLRELGFYAGVTQDLGRFVTLGLRYDRYDPDLDADDLRHGVQVLENGAYSTIAAAAQVRWAGHGRFVAEYDHNDNALGRTTAGLPTRLADDAFLVRGEVDF